MSKNLVDIVITTRNNFKLLRETLQSVAKQTFSDYQCYVVDDCSTDDTVSKIKEEFSWVVVLESGRRQGPSKNRNLAIASGKSPFIATLDDDIILPPEWLKEMIEFISFSSKIGIVGSQLRFLHSSAILNSIGGVFTRDGFGKDLFFNIPLNEVKDLVQRPMRIVYACSAAMLMRRIVFEQIKGFDPLFFFLAEDYDLGLRTNLCGYISVYNPKAIAYHIYHVTARSFSEKTLNYFSWRNSLSTILKNFSFISICKTLPLFFNNSRKISVSMTLKVFTWNLFHLGYILRWRKYIRKYKVIDEIQIFSLSQFLLSSLEKSISAQKQFEQDIVGKSENRKLTRYIFKNILSLKQRLSYARKKFTYVKNIIFQITNMCNANCGHCFLRSVLNKNKNSILSLEEVERFFKSLGRVDNIVIGGGEPFLRDEIGKICIMLDRLCKPTSITISTNGSLVDTIFEQTKFILENTNMFLKISLSLDGPAEFHNKFRGIEGLFEKIQASYDKLVFLYYVFYPRLIFQINSTVFAENFKYISDLFYLVRERFPLASFFFELIRGNYDKNLVQPISVEFYEQLIESMTQIYRDIDPLLSEQIDIHRIALQTLKEKKQIIPCNAGRNFIVLDFYGNLYPCEILPPFINIRYIGYNFAKIIKDVNWHRVLSDIRKSKCYCTHMCFLSTSLDETKADGKRMGKPPRLYPHAKDFGAGVK